MPPYSYGALLFLVSVSSFRVNIFPQKAIQRKRLKLFQQQDAENIEPSPIQIPRKSVSDYVGGLHGGKYEFDTRLAGVTALNYEKSVIFDDILSGSDRKVAPAPEETPSWSTRHVSLEGELEKAALGTAVTIVNEEPTWEPIYAEVIGPSNIRVTPRDGTLAPRGGRQSFDDKIDFNLDGDASSLIGDVHLVVRSESDTWTWQVVPNTKE